MPYNSIGGFTALPGQITYGTVYEPRQSTSYLASQGPPRRPPPKAAAHHHQQQQQKQQRRGSQDNDGSILHHIPSSAQAASLPSIAASASSSAVHTAGSSSECDIWSDDAPHRTTTTTSHALGGPWHPGLTPMVTEEQQREQQRLSTANGTALFRPRQFTALVSSTADTSPAAAVTSAQATGAVKPLLEPFLNAQELARQGSEETWHTRRLRYLQWLRKGARVAQQKEDARGAVEEGHHTSFSSPGEWSSVASRAGVASVDGFTGGFSRHPSTSRLPRLEQSAASRAASRVPDDARVSGRSELTMLLQPTQLEVSTFAGFPALAFGPNPNEVAVRRLFHLARGASLTPISSPTRVQDGDGTDEEESGEDKMASDGNAGEVGVDAGSIEDGRKKAKQRKILDRSRGESAVVEGTDRPAAAAATPLALVLNDTHAYVDEDGFSFARGARDSFTTDDGGDASSTASKLPIEPPLEYAVTALLRKRMHNTVAPFTASSVHTLDAPPQKTSRTLFGHARLRGEEDSSTAGACSRTVSVTGPQRALSPQTVRRLVYKEAYERGLLRQLAFQSSPTRWYSGELPSGAEGIAFRKAYPPDVSRDAALQARLNGATAHAIETIARPRQEAASGRQQQQQMQLTTSISTLSSMGGAQRLLCGPAIGNRAFPEDASITVEVAAAEKEVLFEQWTRLHRNLSAQWQLLLLEQTERLRLLGNFVSCAYPRPCICLECDQEVLNMSAIPLEPTVKSLCWYTAVVLAQHHEVLQKEMLRQHAEGLAEMYAGFRVLFVTTYTREKLLEEEARRFNTMLHYHEFCLRVAAQEAGEQHAKDSRRASAAGATAADEASEEAEHGGHLRKGTEEWMWRLRQRRLQAYKAFDSPFFSYLVYTEMITVTSAEAQVRAMLVEEEETRRHEWVALVRRDEQYSAFLALERRRRSWIAAEAIEAYSAMMSGPLVQLHAAHMAELREAEAAAAARLSSREQQTFVNAAYDEKLAVRDNYYAQYKILVREIRQQFLALLVANRSPSASVTVSHNWLHEQAQSALMRREQRLRDRIVLEELPAAVESLLLAVDDSRRVTAEKEGLRRAREDAAAAAMAAEATQISAQARLQFEADEWSRLQRARMEADPSLRPSAKLPADSANDCTKLTMTLNEDFVFFLSALD